MFTEHLSMSWAWGRGLDESSSLFIYSKKYLQRAYCMPDTLAGASVENTTIYLRSLLIMNTGVTRSVSCQPCCCGHSSHMCLPELICKRFTQVVKMNELQLHASACVSLRNIMLSQKPKTNTKNLQNNKCSMIPFISNQKHAKLNNMLFRDTCIWDKTIIKTRE